MSRVDTNQATVLQAVVDRLIASVVTDPKLTDETCFASLFPVPPLLLPSNLFLTVAPIEGQFEPGLHEGGGIYQTSEEAGVVVTVFTRMLLDRGGRSVKVLTESTRGLLVVKRLVLKALSGHDLVDPVGNQLLRNLMAPLNCDPPKFLDEDKIGYLSLRFSTDFDWDLQS
jgi:hypothetical protein